MMNKTPLYIRVLCNTALHKGERGRLVPRASDTDQRISGNRKIVDLAGRQAEPDYTSLTAGLKHVT